MNGWHIGTAGWSIASRHAQAFPAIGSALERYSRRLGAVEINSSFSRSHRPETWQRWADSVASGFRFSVKLPRRITHDLRLLDCEASIDSALAEFAGLGDKLSVLLVQLPPSLPFDARAAAAFFATLRRRTSLDIAFEPRHASWSDREANALLMDFRVARVAADPAPFAGAGLPAGWPGLAYFRLHGSPRVYYSDYSAEALASIERRLREYRAAGAEVWCIFDNTAASHALGNALTIAAANDDADADAGS